MAKTTVVWKYQDKEEQRKEFPDFVSAMQFQRTIVKKKKGLEYATYETEKTDNPSINNQNSEDKTMTNEKKAADLIGKTIVVNGSDVKYVIKSVDGDKLMADFIMGDRTMPCPIPMSQVENMVEAGKWAIEDAPDAEASATETKTATAEDVKPETCEPETSEEPTATADEVEEVQDVEEPAMTVKMQPKDKAEEPKAKTEKPQTRAKTNTNGTNGTNKPAAGRLRYETYTTKKGKTGAKIVGFNETDAAYLAGPDLHGSKAWETDKQGNKQFCLLFSHRYAKAAEDVCDALNKGKSVADCQAIIDGCTEERAQRREEWRQKRAEREARNANANESENAGGKTYTEAEVADLLKRVMEGDAEAMRIVNAMQKAA